MKTDSYTRFVLTVIAVCLVVIAIRGGFVEEAQAQSTMDVNVVSVQDIVRVKIVSIKKPRSSKSGRWDAIRVE